MPCQSISSDAFQCLVDDNELVFVTFSAQWCAPCKPFAKAYEKISALFPMIQFLKINIEEQQALANFFEIRSIPHLMIFKEGMVIYSDAGSFSESALNELVQQALDLDIAELRE